MYTAALLLLFDYYLFYLLEGTVYTAAPLSSAGLFTCTILFSIFCKPKFSANAKKNKKNIINISSYVLRFVCFPVQNIPSSGFSVACA